MAFSFWLHLNSTILPLPEVVLPEMLNMERNMECETNVRGASSQLLLFGLFLIRFVISLMYLFILRSDEREGEIITGMENSVNRRFFIRVISWSK